VTELHGTGEGETDAGLVLALAKFGSIPCLVVGYDRDHEGGSVGPGGLRQARRGMRLAAEWRLPLVTIVDTGGATLSREAEEGGLAAEIARCLADLSLLRTPTVCLLLGQGAGGAALALLPADRVICAQHAWLAALLPEGASAVRYGGTDRASAMASAQGVRSLDLLEQGIVDRVIPEEPDAAEDPSGFLRRVGEILEYELAVLATRPADSRLRERTMRYRRLGASCELTQE
jgi:acetyl-CoA carboxylase carboxyl transferase subunit beta